LRGSSEKAWLKVDSPVECEPLGCRDNDWKGTDEVVY